MQDSRLEVSCWPRKNGALVDAVDQAVGRRLAAGEAQQRREHVGDMDHFVALGARLDVVRPADQARRADAAFGRTEVRAVEEAAGAAAGEMILGAVVAAHHHDGVVGDAELVELVEQHAEVVVEHQQAVAPVAIVALADEFVARDSSGNASASD